jgi:four helix bundle protein
MNFERDIYTLTEYFPESERNGLSQKLRNKVTDVPMTLAAALNGISTTGVSEALAALAQTETLLIICKHLKLATDESVSDFQTKIRDLKSHITSLNNRLQKQ